MAAALWLAAPIAAHSAGLGRLTVLSALGRPLNAEIELVTAPGDQDIVARLPSPEAFSRAGIEMSPALISARFSIERRNGRQVVRVTTTQPVNEPFLDLLVDLQWNSGRLLREYTVLLDPPEFKRQAIAAAPPPPKPVAAAPAAPAAPAPAPAATAEAKPAPTPVESKPAPVEAKPLPPESAPAAPVAAAPAAKPEAAQPEAGKPAEKAAEAAAPMGAATHEVQKGETLGAIARRNLPPGVSLNQMLIAIYRANEDAFINGNINLVRAGRILNIPDIDAVATVDAEAANRLVKEHHAQFNEYRSRLAEVPAAAETAAGQRDAAGRIEPKPEAAPAKPQDQVRLSKADPKKPATPGARAAREDDQVARQREMQEAQSRVAELEKNVSDLQKLLEMKNQQLAELEKKAGAQAAAPSAAPVPPPAKPAAKAPEKPAAKAPEAPKPPAPAPAPAQPQAAKPPAPAQPPAPAAKAPAKPKPRPAAPPPPEPSLLDELLAPFEDPMLLGGLGVVLLGLIGYAAFVWRRKKAAQAKFQDSVLGAAAAGAVAGTAEPGPTVQPAAAPSPSQAPAGMEAEEVDPIAEADVYIAYGRDAQAEQILKEALQKDSRRTAVHAKLLEIYAARKDTKSFEQTALKVKELAGGGPEWDKACALGRSIDPQNGLYGNAEPSAPVAAPAAAAAAAPMLDFDLGGASQNPTAAPDISLDDTPKESSASDIDINLVTTSMPAVGGAAAEQEKTVTSMDFNLDLGGEKKDEPAAAEPAPAAEPSSGLDFDLKLDDLPADKPAEEKSAPPVDLGAISLDLGGPADASGAAGSTDPKWQEVATKLDLAKAYEEMGDKNGARELLNEVMKDGDAAQKGQAEQLLAKLG